MRRLTGDARRMLLSAGTAVMLHLGILLLVEYTLPDLTSPTDSVMTVRLETRLVPASEPGAAGEETATEGPEPREVTDPPAVTVPPDLPEPQASREDHASQAEQATQAEDTSQVQRAAQAEQTVPKPRIIETEQDEAPPEEVPEAPEAASTAVTDPLATPESSSGPSSPGPSSPEPRAASFGTPPGARMPSEARTPPGARMPSEARTPPGARMPSEARTPPGARETDTFRDTVPTPPAIQPERYVEPRYPEAARRSAIEGAVVVSVRIDRRGRVEEVHLSESSGFDVLDREALRAVRLWRFSREEAGRESVHRIVFRLD